MATEKRWDDAAKKLLTLTRERKLEWYIGVFDRDHAIGPVFVTVAMNRLIALYEYEYQSYDPDRDTFSTETEVAIEFVKDSGLVEYQWPIVAYRRAILDAIQYNLSRAGEFLDKFLADE